MSTQAGSEAASGTGTHEFRAETRQLLDIVIHSLYSNREIFLRELISNASDALDRLRFQSLTEDGLMEPSEVLEILIDSDPDERTLQISDNGVGMSREEVIENIGTIAKSGTRQVLEEVEASGSSSPEVAELIGQFGVGFYSSFMVADRVVVVSRRAGEERATRWESTGDGQFEIADDQRFLRGTTITLHLKPVDEDAGLEDFTRFEVIQRIVKRYSDFVSYPVRSKRHRTAAEKDDPSQPTVEEVTLNSMKPIWTRTASDVSDEEYNEFYKHIAHDWNEPAERLLLHAEGRIEYTALLYIPSKAPFDLFYRDQQPGLQLYVRKILIKDRCEELLPPHFRFVRGVVDSADLQLNISREMLQQDRHMTQMRRWISRKITDSLSQQMENDRPAYNDFWQQFGRVLKEGVGMQAEGAERLTDLLLFESSGSDEESTSLAEYVERMREGQDEIYYLTGESRSIVENSPQLEGLRDQGIEVLYLVDPIDEFLVQSLPEFDGKALQSAARGTVNLDKKDDAGNDSEPPKDEEYSDLLRGLESRLNEHVKEVRLSSRLISSPACLVLDEGDMSPQLERLLQQADSPFGGAGAQKRILELNGGHDVVTKLQGRFAENPDDPLIESYAQLLLGYALIAEGSKPPEPGEFNRLLADLMASGL